MNGTRLTVGFLLVVAATWPTGAPAEDTKFSAPPRKESPSLPDKKRGSAPDQEAARGFEPHRTDLPAAATMSALLIGRVALLIAPDRRGFARVRYESPF